MQHFDSPGQSESYVEPTSFTDAPQSTVFSGSGFTAWHSSGSGIISTVGHFPGFSRRKCHAKEKFLADVVYQLFNEVDVNSGGYLPSSGKNLPYETHNND